MKYYAHTVDGRPENEWHTLAEHLKGTGGIASFFTNNETYSNLFRIAGYLHDLGKYQPAFQKYLKEGGRRGSVPHAKFGALVFYTRMNEISRVIAGHHGGLQDNQLWKMSMLDLDDDCYDEIINIFERDIEIPLESFLQYEHQLKRFSHLEREFITRYIFSALTDADWLDTERCCSLARSGSRIKKSFEVCLFIEKIEKYINQFGNNKINVLRDETRKAVIAKAECSTGFYSLNLPTGLGKTITSFQWALFHAKKNNLKRIIIVLPFLNIIDQTAKLLKDILGDENVLEHHSGYNFENDYREDNEEYSSLKLASENWDYPVIVTTTVQFFESLFSNKPSKCRKIHNIADSVVIFDEVQTLERSLVLPSLDMLKNIHKIMNASFLFCTATLPAFSKRNNFNGIENIVPLFDNVEMLFKETIRVEYELINNLNDTSINEIVEHVSCNDQSLLIVFNTKKVVKDFYDLINESCKWDKVYYLTTNLCPHHRKLIIDGIRTDLKSDLKIIVISTQLIEAGVDFDFPVVYRALAPLESIIQSAGRCNREGKLDRGKVFIFQLDESKYPSTLYKTESIHAKNFIERNIERLYDHSSYTEYYEQIMSLYITPKKITEERIKNNFETVKDMYRLIDDHTYSLFIMNYSDESMKICNEIEHEEFLSMEIHQKLQQYTITVYPNFLKDSGNLCKSLQNGVMVYMGKYDDNTGIDEGNNLDPLIV